MVACFSLVFFLKRFSMLVLCVPSCNTIHNSTCMQHLIRKMVPVLWQRTYMRQNNPAKAMGDEKKRPLAKLVRPTISSLLSFALLNVQNSLPPQCCGFAWSLPSASVHSRGFYWSHGIAVSSCSRRSSCDTVEDLQRESHAATFDQDPPIPAMTHTHIRSAP